VDFEKESFKFLGSGRRRQAGRAAKATRTVRPAQKAAGSCGNRSGKRPFGAPKGRRPEEVIPRVNVPVVGVGDSLGGPSGCLNQKLAIPPPEKESPFLIVAGGQFELSPESVAEFFCMAIGAPSLFAPCFFNVIQKGVSRFVGAPRFLVSWILEK